MVCLPPEQFIDPERFTELLELFDSDAQNASESSIESLQYPAQRDLLTQGGIAVTQIIQWSSGLVNVAPNTSYVFIIGGITVCCPMRIKPLIALTVRCLASFESWFSGTCASTLTGFPSDDSVDTQHLTSSDPLQAPVIDLGYLHKSFGTLTIHIIKIMTDR